MSFATDYISDFSAGTITTITNTTITILTDIWNVIKDVLSSLWDDVAFVEWQAYFADNLAKITLHGSVILLIFKRFLPFSLDTLTLQNTVKVHHALWCLLFDFAKCTEPLISGTLAFVVVLIKCIKRFFVEFFTIIYDIVKAILTGIFTLLIDVIVELVNMIIEPIWSAISTIRSVVNSMAGTIDDIASAVGA